MMKTGEVLRLLRISRSTLYRWVAEGLIQRKKIGKRYDYFDEDVYKLLTKDMSRKTYMYARVATTQQKTELQTQITMLTSWCVTNGYQLHGIFADVASGIHFEGRQEFFKLLDDVMDYKVEKVIVAYKDRVSRVGFTFFDTLFRKFGTEIIVISEIGNQKLMLKKCLTNSVPCYTATQ